MRKWPSVLRTTTFRLTLIYFGLFGVSAVVLVGFLYWSTAGFMARQTDEAIEAEIRGLAEQYSQFGTIGLVRALNRRTSQARASRGLYLLTDASLRPLAGNLSAWPREDPRPDGWITFELEYADRRGAVDLGRARIFELTGGLRLLVGRDIRERLEIDARFRESIGWGIALALVLSIAGGVLISRPMLRRIDAINLTSREIMAGALDRRIPVRGTSDEFDRLAANLNEMLDRIAQLVASVREVSDNIAHDLRSPLARLRSRLELTLADEGDAEAYRRAIGRTIEEADALLKTFNSLLRIARLEAGVETGQIETFDLDGLIGDVAELYAPLAEERGVALDTGPGGAGRITGDRDLLFQALANLLDNAIKFSPEGGTVAIAARGRGDGVEIAVADGGPGIPDALKERVTERFFRVEASRNAPGAGLGLSLVAAVAERHGGGLEFGDNEPGLRVALTLPREPAPGAAAGLAVSSRAAHIPSHGA
ncbi:MAG: ATP-binding protein [Defluviicoccus sp.]|nr:ATP-binding protein [Defluviicoccus sp.]MDE0277456.1 ATP-binding protein [Defluviicoccus sp.]